ncbi:hypothetical protein [Pediococcus pentosaceus]|uniref:hypothetical protein n=1 Tax=Pediococcus pentosaceus TaxID=1255 RepID=UPI0035939551
MKKLANIIPIILIIGLFIGMIGNLVVQNNIVQSCVLIAAAIFVWLSRTYLSSFFDGLTSKQMKASILGGLIVILVVQILVLVFIPATVYHDPFRVLYQAELLSHNEFNWSNSTYFWRYPNNVFLSVFLGQWLKITNLFHLTTNISIHILSIIFLDSFIGITLCRTFFKKHRQDITMFLLIFFIISPFAYTYYLQVFYSDLPLLLFILLTFIILSDWTSFSRKLKIAGGIALFAITILAELIKPNFILLAIAIVVVMVFMLFTNRSLLMKFLLPFIIILAGFGIYHPISNAVNQSVHFQTESKYEMPMTNWIWMSYNPHSNGTYVGKDIAKMNQLPTKQARSKYIKKALPKRIKKLGVRGLLSRWLGKAVIFFDVGKIQKSYTGGFISAPAAYQKIQTQLSVLGSLIMRIGFIMIYGSAIISCLKLIKSRGLVNDPVALLTLTLAVGYFLFHTLIWESESRYGQAVMPLLLMTIASSASESSAIQKPIIGKRTQRLAGTIVAISAISIGIVSGQPFIKAQSRFVARQGSQLSMQYHARPFLLQGHDSAIQSVVLNHQASKFTITTQASSGIQAELLDVTTHHRYQFKQTTDRLTLHQQLNPGNYEIRIKNNSNIAAPISIIKTKNYQLAPKPLKINHQSNRNASLIYSAQVKFHNR